MKWKITETHDIDELELDRCSQTLGLAFENYALMHHFIDPENRARRISEYQDTFLRKVGMRAGHVWSADGGVAVAVWTAPDLADPATVFGPLAEKFTHLAGSRASIMQASEAVMARFRPQEPCWFLGTVGVHPDHRGRGLGRAVIEAGLARAAKEGFPAFLETSDETNVAIYERLGFAVTSVYDLPFGGPRTYSMLSLIHI